MMRQSITSLIIKIIHILKAEIRAIGTETMKRIYGKELGYMKKTKVYRLKGFKAFWKKIMRNMYISTYLYNIFNFQIRDRRVANIWV